MKTFGRFLLALAVGLCAAAAVQLQAQTFPVTVQLTLQQQDFSSLKNGVYTDKVKTTRLNSTSLLALVAEAYKTEFPTGFPFGSRLVLVDYDHFQVQTAGGAILVTNASPSLTYSDSYSESDYLFQGKESTINGSQSHTYFYRATIEFNNPATNGTSFTFSGNMLEKYSKSTVDSLGERLYSSSLALTGTGSGKTGDSFFLLSGRITTPAVKWVQ